MLVLLQSRSGKRCLNTFWSATNGAMHTSKKKKKNPNKKIPSAAVYPFSHLAPVKKFGKLRGVGTGST